jgi:hypothetical protein
VIDPVGGVSAPVQTEGSIVRSNHILSAAFEGAVLVGVLLTALRASTAIPKACYHRNASCCASSWLADSPLLPPSRAHRFRPWRLRCREMRVGDGRC